MSIYIQIHAENRDLEGILLYLDTLKHLSLSEKKTLLKQAAKWLDFSDKDSYPVGQIAAFEVVTEIDGNRVLAPCCQSTLSQSQGR